MCGERVFHASFVGGAEGFPPRRPKDVRPTERQFRRRSQLDERSVSGAAIVMSDNWHLRRCSTPGRCDFEVLDSIVVGEALRSVHPHKPET